jgi:hypothetical protein
MTAVATNLNLDPELLDHAFRLSGERSKKAAVTKALEEFIARRELAGLADLLEQVTWDPEYDYKAERGARDRRHEAMGLFQPPSA